MRRYGEKVLAVQNLTMGRMVRNTSFSIYAGQITGVFGLVGSGRTETAKVVSGVLKRDLFHGGRIEFDGQAVRFRTPREAVKRGIVYVTEDRRLEGYFETMTIGENIFVNLLSAVKGNIHLVRKTEIVNVGRKWIEALKVRAIGNDTSVVALSGGNQQKVVVARSLVQEPKLVIFDEPTRGVDVGAIADLHQIINDLADSGIAVVVISSYLPEFSVVRIESSSHAKAV